MLCGIHTNKKGGGGELEEDEDRGRQDMGGRRTERWENNEELI
jgi:hypothetical protein